MERKRAYLEIAHDILLVARLGAKPTALVYGANLNFNIIKKYLREMMEAGLIIMKETGPRSRLYYTTERGLDFCESLMKTRSLYKKAIDWSIFEIPQEAS